MTATSPPPPPAAGAGRTEHAPPAGPTSPRPTDAGTTAEGAAPGPEPAGVPRVGIALPMLGEMAALGVPDVRAMARHVEELGFASVRIADLVLGDGTPALDAVTTAATAAAVTDRVRITFGVRVGPLQPAAWLAAQIATLQHLSGGRVELGIGAGGMPGSPFWRAVGAPERDRGRVLDEVLAVLPGLVAGEPTTVVPGYGAASGEPAEPVTLTLAPGAPVPPILVGGNSRQAMRRAVAYGDGWLPSALPADELRTLAATLRDLAARAGRPVPRITVGGGAVPGTGPAARATREAFVRQLVEGYRRPAEEAARVPIAGGPAQLAEGLAGYAEAGAGEVTVAVLTDGDWMAAVEQLAEARALLVAAARGQA